MFNGDISNWDVSNVTSMWAVFKLSNFNNDISNWDVSNVKDMNSMFEKSVMSYNLESWGTKVNKLTNVKNMFKLTPVSKNRKTPRWALNK
jgi:surface protein